MVHISSSLRTHAHSKQDNNKESNHKEKKTSKAQQWRRDNFSSSILEEEKKSKVLSDLPHPKLRILKDTKKLRI